MSFFFATPGDFHKRVKDDGNCSSHSASTLFCCNCKCTPTLFSSPYRWTVCDSYGHYSSETLLPLQSYHPVPSLANFNLFFFKPGFNRVRTLNHIAAVFLCSCIATQLHEPEPRTILSKLPRNPFFSPSASLKAFICIFIEACCSFISRGPPVGRLSTAVANSQLSIYLQEL